MGPLDSYKCWVQDALDLRLPQLTTVSGGGDKERFRLFRLPSGAAVRSYQVLLIVQLRKGFTLRTTRETYCKKYSMKNRNRVVSIAYYILNCQLQAVILLSYFKDVIDVTCSISHFGVQHASVTALGSSCIWTNMVSPRKEDSGKIGCTGNIKTRSCFGWHLAAIIRSSSNNNNNTKLKCLSIDKVGGVYLRTSNTKETLKAKPRDELFVIFFPDLRCQDFMKK